jgi:hypothetical protein
MVTMFKKKRRMNFGPRIPRPDTMMWLGIAFACLILWGWV